MASRVKKFWREMSGAYRMGGVPLAIKFGTACLVEAPAILAQGKLSAADLRMAGSELAIRAGHATMLIPGAWFAGAREIVARRVYTSLPGFEVRSTDTVVDLGCNVGIFTVMAALQGADVLGIDAQSGLLEEARLNARSNFCADRARFRCALIGDRTGVFSRREALEAASHFVDEPQVMTFPELMEEERLGRIDFLKVDIEGSEFALLHDAPEWLEAVQRVAMEVHPRFGAVGEIINSLGQRGLRSQLTDADLRPVTTLSRDEGGYLFAMRS